MRRRNGKSLAWPVGHVLKQRCNLQGRELNKLLNHYTVLEIEFLSPQLLAFVQFILLRETAKRINYFSYLGYSLLNFTEMLVFWKHETPSVTDFVPALLPFACWGVELCFLRMQISAGWFTHPDHFSKKRINLHTLRMHRDAWRKWILAVAAWPSPSD